MFDIGVTCLFSYDSAEEGPAVGLRPEFKLRRKMWKIETWCPLTKDTSVLRLTYGNYGLRQISEWVSGGNKELRPTKGEPMQILHLLKQFQTLSIHKNWAWRSRFPVLQDIVYRYKTDFNAVLHLLNQ